MRALWLVIQTRDVFVGAGLAPPAVSTNGREAYLRQAGIYFCGCPMLGL